jgi:CheY-like chemotaxis protein
MAILIIEDDVLTRECLSRLVRQLSFEPSLFANDRTESWNQLDQHPSHLRLVLCGKPYPGQASHELLGKLTQHPHLNSVPLVWVVSRGPRMLRRCVLRWQQPRIDEVLAKPFNQDQLAAAMARAYQRRIAHCGTLLYLGPEGPLFHSLAAVIAQRRGQWRRIERFSDLASLQAAIRPLDGQLGGILIDPAVYPALGKRGLHVARDGVVAQRVRTVCLSRDPELAAPLGPFCDRFVDPPQTPRAWADLLGTMATQLRHGWRVHFLTQSFKAAQRGQDHRRVRRRARQLARYAQGHSEAMTLLGQYYAQRARNRAATRHLEMALALNPFFPRVYLLLLKIFEGLGNRARLLEIADLAARYCRHHPETLARVAEVRAAP